MKTALFVLLARDAPVGAHMSDIDDKILKWLDKDFGPAMRQEFSDYASAKAARK